jgi:hypothetical protein
MNSRPQELDWKVFRKMVPDLRERYLDKSNAVLEESFRDDSLTPTEKFWRLEERVQKEARILRQCLDGHSRSRMFNYMLLMYRHKMLTDKDLEEYSEELQAQVLRATKIL